MNKKRIIHGTLATSVTAGAVALVLILNILLTVLAGGGMWFIDLTKENLYKISDESKEMLSQLKSDENNITIYFLADPDELDNASLTGHTQNEDSSSWGMKYVYEMAKLFASEYDFINVDTLDLKKDSELLRTVYASTVATKFDMLSVIIDNCIDGETHNFRICKRDAFFTFDSNSSLVYAANGDFRYTSTILSLGGTFPTAYFVEGHGEKIGDTKEDFGKASGLVELFAQAGFKSVKIDLQNEDFPDDSTYYDNVVNGAGVVVIYGPEEDYISDYGDSSKANEITKIRKYVNAKNHHLMVFLDPGVPELPNLEEYLYDFWGVGFSDNVVIADTKDERTTSSLSNDGRAFYAEYETSETSVGASLTASLTDNLDSLPGAYFKNARTIRMRSDYSGYSGAYEQERNSTIYLSPVFRAPLLSSAEYESGEVEAYAQSVYDRYYESFYDKDDPESEYSKTFSKYSSQYDEIYLRMYDEKKEEFYSDKYDSLYDEKLLAFYNSYLEEHKDDGLSESELDEKAIEYAYSEYEKIDEEVKNEAKIYSETKIEEIKESGELGTITEKEIKNLTDSHMSDYLRFISPSALMTLTYEMWSNQLSNNRIPTYILSCGTTEFADPEILSSGVYGNRDVIYYAMRLIGKENVPFEIDFTVLEKDSLNTENVNTTALTIVFSVVPTLIVIAAGATVLILRRKNR